MEVRAHFRILTCFWNEQASRQELVVDIDGLSQKPVEWLNVRYALELMHPNQ